MYKSCEELRKDAQKYSDELKSIFDGSSGKKYVCLCGGTGCISGGTPEIRQRFEECLKNYKLEDKVEIRVTGCFGLCSQGPFVRIYPEDVTYRLVSVADVEDIVVMDLRDDMVVERLVYEDPATGEKIRKLEEYPFYRK